MSTSNIKMVQEKIEECCPLFYPEKWDHKTVHWKNKHFVKASVPALFHRPSTKMIGKKITKIFKQAEESKKMAGDKEDILLLFNDPHAFRSDMYLSVTDDVPEAKNTTISGTFMAKVFDGPFKDIPKFFKEMDAYLKKMNKKAKDYYVHYAYCPKCAEEKGHNYMVFFAEVQH